MQFTELQKLDPSLKLLESKSSDLDFISFCAPHLVKENSIILIKSKKFLEKVFSLLAAESYLKTAVFLDEKYAQSIQGKEEFDKLKKIFGLVASTKDIGLCMSFLSPEFYQLKHFKNNNLVDGRQMGTAIVHPTATIAQNVFLGSNVKIEAYVEILSGSVILANSVIGERTKIYPNVTIYEDVEIGKDCRIHSGTVIGSDGFGYNFHQGKHLKVWHVGGVRVQAGVEIGANVTIDQGTFAPTEIGAGSIIDNQVQIGHNCILGRGVVLCGQVGLAGSSKVGDYSVFGGKAGLGPDTEVGAQVQVAGGSLVSHSWPSGSVIAGHPARPLKEWMKGLALVRKMVEKHQADRGHDDT